MPFRKFIPNPEQKRFVIALAGTRLGHEQIRSVVRNPATDRPLSRATFARVFKDELATAKTRMQAVVISKYYEALARGEQWAVLWGLKHHCGYRDNDLSISIGDPSGAEAEGIQVTFVRPTKWVNGGPEAEAGKQLGPTIEHDGFNGGRKP